MMIIGCKILIFHLISCMKSQVNSKLFLLFILENVLFFKYDFINQLGPLGTQLLDRIQYNRILCSLSFWSNWITSNIWFLSAFEVTVVCVFLSVYVCFIDLKSISNMS